MFLKLDVDHVFVTFKLSLFDGGVCPLLKKKKLTELKA